MATVNCKSFHVSFLDMKKRVEGSRIVLREEIWKILLHKNL